MHEYEHVRQASLMNYLYVHPTAFITPVIKVVMQSCMRLESLQLFIYLFVE